MEEVLRTAIYAHTKLRSLHLASRGLRIVRRSEARRGEVLGHQLDFGVVHGLADEAS